MLPKLEYRWLAVREGGGSTGSVESDLNVALQKATAAGLYLLGLNDGQVTVEIHTQCSHCSGEGRVRKERSRALYATKVCPDCKGLPLVAGIGRGLMPLAPITFRLAPPNGTHVVTDFGQDDAEILKVLGRSGTGAVLPTPVRMVCTNHTAWGELSTDVLPSLSDAEDEPGNSIGGKIKLCPEPDCASDKGFEQNEDGSSILCLACGYSFDTETGAV